MFFKINIIYQYHLLITFFKENILKKSKPVKNGYIYFHNQLIAFVL